MEPETERWVVDNAADKLSYSLNQDGGGTTYAYDANGSRVWQSPIGEIAAGNPLTTPTSYTYDAALRLTSVTLPIASAPHSFTYDHTGIRHGHTAPDGGTDVLLWDGAPLAWIGGADTPTSDLAELFVQTPDARKTLRALGQTRSGIVLSRQYHLDSMGSAESLSAGNGSSSFGGVATYNYDAWGDVLSTGGAGDDSGAPVLPLANADFELPNVGSDYYFAFKMFPPGTGVGWTFLGTGVSGNGSGFTGGNPDAPVGAQVAVLYGTGSFWQWITLPVAGTLQVSFYAAQRGSGSNPGSPIPNQQEFQVSVGDVVIGTYTPSGASYESIETDPAFFAAGTYALTFTGLNPLGSDNTALIDSVTLSYVPATPVVQDNPLQYLGGLGYWQGETADLGLTYVRQRWLDTGSGQWISVDPVDSEPRYGYAHNSPTVGVDPTGQFDILGYHDWHEFVSSLHYFPSAFSDTYVKPTETFLHAAWNKLEAKLTQSKAALINFAHHIGSLPIVKNLVPSAWDAEHIKQYVYGIGVGVFRGIVGLFPVGFALEVIYDLLWDVFMKHKGFIQAFVEMIQGFLSGPSALFTQVLKMTDKDRGEIVGNILVTIVILLAIVFTGGAAAGALAAIPGNIARAALRAGRILGAEARSLVLDTANAGRQVGQAIGQAGERLSGSLAPQRGLAFAGAGGFPTPPVRINPLVSMSTAAEEGAEVARATTQSVGEAAKTTEQAAKAVDEISKVKDVASVAADAAKQTSDALGKAGALREAELLAELTGKTYRRTEFLGPFNGNPKETLGEIDKVEDGVFVEDKEGRGLGIRNPRTGQVSQTPEQWAIKQIYNKTVPKIVRLPLARVTQPQPGADNATLEQPSPAAMQLVRKFRFEVAGNYPGMEDAVRDVCARLKREFPDWDFTYTLGQ